MAQLAARHGEFDALGLGVVTISFGRPEWAAGWREATGSAFPLLLDPTRAAYRAYRLERSIWRSWGPASIRYYAAAILFRGGRVRVDRGDTNQLGGDFIVDRQGALRFVYYSRNPTDRPATAHLLAVAAP